MGKFKPSVEIPKNVKLTEEYVESHRENIIDMMKRGLLKNAAFQKIRLSSLLIR